MIARILAFFLVLTSLKAADSWKIDFGTGTPEKGFTAVHPNDRFDTEKGYGFDLAGKPEETKDAITGKGGFLFSVAVPEGNYRVRVKLGADSDTTIKAESRRLMLEAVKTPPTAGVVETFTVHVRTPAIPGGDRVRLKDREKPYLHWDSKLSLEINGPQPSVELLEITPAPDATTVFLLGDSTVTDQPYTPWNSWGQMLPRFFDDSVAIANFAESGESVRSSLGAKRFEKVYRSIKPGDYVLIQFGHNDMKDKSPNALETYTDNLTKAVATIRSHKAHPILITSMERKSGVKSDTLAGYPGAVREVAEKEKVPLIDLHRSSRTLYQALGKNLDAAFQDGTHHNNFGSYLLARCVVEGIRKSSPDLAKHLRPEPGTFDPSNPGDPSEFAIAVSPMANLRKPDGD